MASIGAPTVVTICQKYGLPPFTKSVDFEQWLYEIEIWQLVTDLPKAKHGPVVLLSLEESIRYGCSSLTKEELSADDGLDKLIEKLRELYAYNKDQATFNAYESFETFQRPVSMPINDYISKFEQLNQKLINYKIILPPAVLAYQVLKNANLSQDKRSLIRATLTEVTYETMKKQIKAVHDHCTSSELSNAMADIKVEDAFYEETFYGFNRNRNSRAGYQGGGGRYNSGRGNGGGGQRYNQQSNNRGYRPSGGRGGNRNNNSNNSNNSNNNNWRDAQSNDNIRNANSRFVRTKNLPDVDGNPTKCIICESVYHYAKNCPDSNTSRRVTEEVHIQMFTKGVSQCYLEQVVSESLNCALLDTGCNATVCGKNWLKCYTDTLNEGTELSSEPSDKKFKFGDGPLYNSLQQVNIPADIGGIKGYILTDVVDCEIPLLLSKESLKAADSQLDFVNDTITMYGQEIALQHTSNGHYCIPISKKQIAVDTIHSERHPVKVTLSINSSDDVKKDTKQMAVKLHRQFGHPVDSTKLKNLVIEAGMDDKDLLKAIERVTEECDVCNRYKKAKARPVVSFSLAKDVNECLALDLKFITIKDKQYIILHMIDTFSRFSAAVIIPSKRKEVIVDHVLRHWVATFGTPESVISDNGREFNNELLHDVAELLGTKVLTTAAEAPWSNGIVERHNAIIGNMIMKIVADTGCSVENALVWAVSAKNALHNNLGFSSNQLVFGKNPNLPSVLTAKPPALRTTTSSELIAEHLNALHAARRAFINSESSSKIKRALSHQTRNCSSKEFFNGDQVYFKRNNDKEWRGPGVILGIDGKQVLVRCGGTCVRVSPCSLRKITEGFHTTENINAMDQDSLRNLSSSSILTLDDTIATHNHTRHLIDINTPVLRESTDAVVIPDTNELTNESLTESDSNTDTPILRESNDAVIVPDTDELTIPRIHDRVAFIDPDSKQPCECIIINRAGKAKGKHKHWFNVKNLVTGEMKSVNFEDVPQWEKLDHEILYSSANSPDVLQAQSEELEKWVTYKVYTEVIDKGQDAISTKWVLTEKQENNEMHVKARLVARGFEEDSTNIRKDSPTISKENIRLICSIAVNNNWKIHSIDVKSAFLQGFPIDREVFLIPPPEAGTTNLWKLNTSVYGLRDASRAWYLKVSDELIKAGATQSIYDHALFFWRDKNELGGILCSHVDDFFFAGTERFHNQIIHHIRQEFKLSQESNEAFQFLGINIIQMMDKIIMDQQCYIDSLEPINVLENTTDQPLDIIETRRLKGLVGQLQWVSKQTRPDMAFASCELSASIKNATTHTMKHANKQLRKLKLQSTKLVIPQTGPINNAELMVYSDASHANLPDGSSQGGFIIFLYGGNGRASPLIWVSRKLKRVVKSAMAAETMSLLEAAEHAMLLKVLLCEIMDVDLSSLPIRCTIDNKPLYDALLSTKVTEDKRLLIDINILRQMLKNKEIDSIRHTPSSEMLADCLTKASASPDKLLQAIGGKILAV